MSAATRRTAPHAAHPGPALWLWVNDGLFGALALKRLLFVLALPLPLATACTLLGQGVLGIAVFAVGLWPFPFRCRLDETGLLVSWFVLRDHFPWEELRSVAIREDRRRFILGKNPGVLVIERASKPPLTLRGRPDLLAHVERELSRYVPPRHFLI